MRYIFSSLSKRRLIELFFPSVEKMMKVLSCAYFFSRQKLTAKHKKLKFALSPQLKNVSRMIIGKIYDVRKGRTF